MTPDDVVQHFGNGVLAHAADATGFTRQAIYKWRGLGYIPIASQWRLHVLSGGKLPMKDPDWTEAS